MCGWVCTYLYNGCKSGWLDDATMDASPDGSTMQQWMRVRMARRCNNGFESGWLDEATMDASPDGSMMQVRVGGCTMDATRAFEEVFEEVVMMEVFYHCHDGLDHLLVADTGRDHERGLACTVEVVEAPPRLV